MTGNGMNRRDFLRFIAGSAISLGAMKTGLAEVLSRKQPTTTSRPAEYQAAYLGKSLVVEVHSDRVISFDGFNRRILQDMITSGLNELTGVTSFSSALNELFSKKDIIGFKFDEVQASLIRTNVPLAEELLRLMVRNGFDARRIYFIGVQPDDAQLPRTAKVKFGWGPEVNFGSGKDRMISVLDELTAIVNVGSLKADSLTGLSGCLKNMTYGVLKHPARFYANQCTPFIADIYALPAIRNKVRFNLLSALRILTQAEEIDEKNSLFENRTLYFSRDVVAVDSVGFERLDEVRKKVNLPPIINGSDFPLQLLTAYRKGLGVYHPDQIFLKKTDIF